MRKICLKIHRWLGLVLQLHTGGWGGMAVKIIYFLAALIGGLLPWSGYCIWWKRTHPRESRIS